MIKNYFKIAWRNLQRNKGYAFINIAGLSLSMACGLLIFTLTNFHFSFDTFHKNKDRIYRVVTEIHNENVGFTPGVPPPFAKTFRADYANAEKVARVVTFGNMLISIVSEKEIKKFQEETGIACAEPEFFEILDFPLAQGDMKTALSEPNTAVVTQKMAKKYFGAEEPMGKTFLVDNKTIFKITGILKDLPLNTDRRQEIYVSNLSMKDLNAWMVKDKWTGINSETHCFILLKPGVKAAGVESFFASWLEKYRPTGKDKKQAYQFKMQPLSDLHFNPNYNGYVDKKYLWALALIGIFLIITACVNFINLATALALNRSKEVGIRKVLGSMRSQLFWQFIAETSLITFFAVLLAIVLALLGTPYLNGLFKTALTLNFFNNITLPIFITLLFIVVVFLSGSYPGLVLSGFQPVIVLKGKLSQTSIGGFSLRRILVVTQFAISQALIIGTIVIASQMNFIKKTDLGFTKDAVLMLPVPVNDSIGKIKMETLRNRLDAIPGVEKVAFCMQAPASDANNTTDVAYNNSPKEELWEVNHKDADDQYLPAFGLKLIAGRNLYPSDTVREYLVNETFVKKLNLPSPQDIINKTIKINGKKALVVGVLKDFYNYSFHDEVAAIAIASNYKNYENCAVKFYFTGQDKPLLTAVEKAWNQTYPEYVYNPQFLDERIAKFYQLDDIMLKLIEVFACIAIFIGCLGLYGLVSFMAVRKTKEIGIRKVLGADVKNILWLFGKEFTRLLLIAFFIAAPAAWWAMHKYLLDFKYRINIGVEIFLTAIMITFIIAAVTVSYQSLKASLANPVKSLRTE